MLLREEENQKIAAVLSRAVIWVCLGFLAGVAGGSIRENIWFFTTVLMGGVFLAVVFEKSWKKKSSAFFIFVLFLCAGAWHMNARAQNLLAFPSAGYFAVESSGEREIFGYVGDVRKETDRNLQVRIDAKEIYAADHMRREKITGSILAFIPIGTRVAVGEYVAIRGELKRPEPIETFDYPRYLAAQGIGAVMFRASIEAKSAPVQSDMFRTLLAKIARLRVHGRDILARYVGGVEGEVFIASSLGYPLSHDTQQLFSRAGITHLVAISGMNIALVMSIFSGVLIAGGIRRQKSILLSLLGIVVFVFLVGLGASVVRAAIMGAILYTGSVAGRPLSTLRLLLYVGVLMLLFNPFLLFGDVGFQLSFAAIVGIVLCAPYFDGVFRRIREAKKDIDAYTHKSFGEQSALWRLARQTTALSLAAIIFTAPLTAFHFGILSIIGIALNIIAVPLFPFVLICAFCAIVLGTIAFPLGALPAWTAWFFLLLLKEVARASDAIPLSAVMIDAGQEWILLGGYALVGGFMIWLVRRGYNPLTASVKIFEE